MSKFGFTSHRPVPPWGTLTFSFLIPGLGQFLAGRIGSGIAWLAAFTVAWPGIAWLAACPRFPGLTAAIMAVVMLFAAWLGMLVHAYRCGERSAEPSAKRPWIAAFLSALLPGSGQLYNRQFWTGSLFLAGVIAASQLPLVPSVIALALLRIWASLDGYRHAGRHMSPAEELTRLLAMALVLRPILALGVVVGIRSFEVEPFKMPSSSMTPTMLGRRTENGEQKEGDHFFVDKLSYRLTRPRRGDIVVFRTDGIQGLGGSKFSVKRMVGLPGERISIRPPLLFINGEHVTATEVLKRIEGQRDGYVGFRLAQPVTQFVCPWARETDVLQLGNDQYLVLGDNQNSALDGRYWGALPGKNIVGKATKIYWPPERMGRSLE